MFRFGLLVPCYNAEKYIHPFLQNLSTLTSKFDEVVFYDDASTDNTLSILKQNNCTVIKGTLNKGASFARNQLAKATSCDWFHFHDIDDFLSPNYLQKTSIIAQSNLYDVVLCNVDWLSENKTHTIIKWRYDNSIQISPVEYTLNNPIGGINGLYRKSFFEKMGGFDTGLKMWEDADLHVRLAMFGASFYVVEETLSFSVRYASTLSSNQSLSWEYRLQALENYAKLNIEHNILHVIGLQSEKLISTFIHYGNLKSAKKALYLAQKCGIKVPTSKNRLWSVLKLIFPANLVAQLRIIHLKISFKQF